MKTFVTLVISTYIFFTYAKPQTTSNTEPLDNSNKELFQDRVNEDSSSDLIDSESYTTRFIAGHKFSLIFGTAFNNWSIKDTVNNVDFESLNLESSAIISYQFHINLLGKIGMFFGSKTGLNYDLLRTGNINPNLGFYMPSVIFGIVDNHKAGQRIYAAVEYSAIYYYKFKIGNKSISEIPNIFSFYLGYENFIKHYLSYSLLLGYRHLNNSPILSNLTNSNSSSSKQKYIIGQHSIFFHLGFNWQLIK